MLRVVTEGRNRLVLLVGRWAVKVPSPRCWRDFAYGMLNNMNEADWHRDHPDYCPVLWSAPGGLAIVMPRVRTLTQAEYDTHRPGATRVEAKPSSWGWLGERIVAVDYGW